MLEHDLSEETRELMDARVSTMYLEILGEKFAIKFFEDLRERICDYVRWDLKSDVLANYKNDLAHEVNKVIEKLLIGDLETIEMLRINSQFSFGHLHEIRLKIMETCGDEINKNLIQKQQKEIRDLKSDINYYQGHY